MTNVDWDNFAKNESYRAVIDPNDLVGIKNSLIDQIHWNAISRVLESRRSIVDFGCGTGRFTQRLIDRGFNYCGVDSSVGMIEAAKRLNASNTAEFIHSRHMPLPFPTGRFDVCLSVWVLQYVMHQPRDERRDVFFELARVLSPFGQLLVIEQASASGRSSGTVTACSTEKDYIEALSPFFAISRIERIRCCKMTRLSSRYLHYGKLLPLKNLAISYLANVEAQQALDADLDVLKSMDYYDILINAVKK